VEDLLGRSFMKSLPEGERRVDVTVASLDEDDKAV